MERGCVVWLTGLPGSGKTTIARVLEKKLVEHGKRVEVLDGDEVRENLSPHLGFSKEDRQIHANRVAYVSKLLSRNGVIAIVGLISPYRDFRQRAREMMGDFVEVYVKCSVDECMERDVKGHYKKAMAGEIQNFTGVSDPYEEPENPEVVVDTENQTPEESADKIFEALQEMGLV
ncbi:MAG: adenylyl-sulfate kinase [Thermoplasmata archaeon]|nr:adenylyl-sulfate kinase [Thermoplasmata archaeon]